MRLRCCLTCLNVRHFWLTYCLCNNVYFVSWTHWHRCKALTYEVTYAITNIGKITIMPARYCLLFMLFCEENIQSISHYLAVQVPDSGRGWPHVGHGFWATDPPYCGEGHDAPDWPAQNHDVLRHLPQGDPGTHPNNLRSVPEKTASGWNWN